MASKRESGISADKRRSSRVADYCVWTETLEKRKAAGPRAKRRVPLVFDKVHELHVGVWGVVLQKRQPGEPHI